MTASATTTNTTNATRATTTNTTNATRATAVPTSGNSDIRSCLIGDDYK